MSSNTATKLIFNERWDATSLWGIELSQFLLHRLEPGEAGSHWKNGITPDVIDFIIEKCKCTYCGSSIGVPLTACACGRVNEDWDGVELAAAYQRQEFDEEVKRLYARQKSRLGSIRRSAAVKAAGGKISIEEKYGLFTAQEGLCFYCAEFLVGQDGRSLYHCDHFVTLRNGGCNDLENAVLACTKCNLLKNSDDGHDFIRRARKLQLARDPLRLAKMRKSLGFWRKSRGLGALSSLRGS